MCFVPKLALLLLLLLLLLLHALLPLAQQRVLCCSHSSLTLTPLAAADLDLC
jgi:hypothetical protein